MDDWSGARSRAIRRRRLDAGRRLMQSASGIFLARFHAAEPSRRDFA